MNIQQIIFQYSDRHAQAKSMLIHTINTVRHCQSFKQWNVFHALCPAPTMASLREAASHVRMSCRLVWLSPSFISQWAPRVRAFNTTHRSVTAPVIPALVKYYYFSCYASFVVFIVCFSYWMYLLLIFNAIFYDKKSKGQREARRESEKQHYDVGKCCTLKCWLPVAMAMGFCRLQDSCYF